MTWRRRLHIVLALGWSAIAVGYTAWPADDAITPLTVLAWIAGIGYTALSLGELIAWRRREPTWSEAEDAIVEEHGRHAGDLDGDELDTPIEDRIAPTDWDVRG